MYLKAERNFMSPKASNDNRKNSESSWSGLYKAGGVCAILYVLFALFVPFFMFINHTELSTMVSGSEIITLITENGSVW